MEDKMSQKEIDNLLKMLHGQTTSETVEIINYTKFIYLKCWGVLKITGNDIENTKYIKFSNRNRTCPHYAINENYLKQLLEEKNKYGKRL